MKFEFECIVPLIVTFTVVITFIARILSMSVSSLFFRLCSKTTPTTKKKIFVSHSPPHNAVAFFLFIWCQFVVILIEQEVDEKWKNVPLNAPHNHDYMSHLGVSGYIFSIINFFSDFIDLSKREEKEASGKLKINFISVIAPKSSLKFSSRFSYACAFTFWLIHLRCRSFYFG